MPRRRGQPTTLASAKIAAGICQSCGERIQPGEPVSWTWARQRIHESCVPISALADRGRRQIGPWVADAVRAFLTRSRGRLCAGCLALGLSLSLDEARAVVSITATLVGFSVLPVSCSQCERQRDVLCMVPVSDTKSDNAGLKCAHCSGLIHDPAKEVVIEEQRFHRSCWQVLSSNELLRASRTLERQSRALIKRSRAKLDEPNEP
jgi:hypothetical protein